MIETDSIALMAKDAALGQEANKLLNRLCEYKYSYHFDWMGRPIIQFPRAVTNGLHGHRYNQMDQQTRHMGFG